MPVRIGVKRVSKPSILATTVGSVVRFVLVSDQDEHAVDATGGLEKMV